MFALVQVLENANPKELCFVEEKDAKAFCDFISTYITESGAGNGYGAYWHHDGEIRYVKRLVGSSKIDADLIKSMAASICDARTASSQKNGRRKNIEYAPEIGERDGAITFMFDPMSLPPRLEPVAGDLVRIVDLPDFDRQIARVVRIAGVTVELKSCPYGIKKGVTLPLANVMKIEDFLRGE